MYAGGSWNHYEANISWERVCGIPNAVYLPTGCGKADTGDAEAEDYKAFYKSDDEPTCNCQKKAGFLFLAYDYTYINSFTVECKYPIPIFQDVLHKVQC